MDYFLTSLEDIKFGLIFGEEKSTFRVFSSSSDIKLRIYEKYNSIVGNEYKMKAVSDSIYEITLNENLEGKFYTYIIDGKYEVTDPYSIACSMDSKRSAIIDLKKTNPKNWENQSIPKTKKSEAIIYELHIKDFTYSKTSGVKNNGKYLGLAENDTKYKGFTTGISHLKNLGITHVHIMPVFDFLTVREDNSLFFDVENYNWGYDPELFNVPEGSYSTNSKKPSKRIFELKKMIMALHNSGIKVVLDVVYTHLYRGEKSNFGVLYPGYYFRTVNGKISNGSGVGNETATEKAMFRKFIIDSITFWMQEYKVDGFRFDLMGLIDIETMEILTKRAKEINPDVLLYGEPWVGGFSPLNRNRMTLRGTQKNKDFSVFNDIFRNCIKGDNNDKTAGFIMGDSSKKICVETGIAGSIDYDSLHKGFTYNPWESINYVNCHDDLILSDKINKVFKSSDFLKKEKLNKLALSIIFLSFGIPFIHEGNEFMRTKEQISNTYNAPITMNAVDWSFKIKNYRFAKYVRDLIEIRKEMKFFSIYDKDEIIRNLKFLDLGEFPIIGYIIKSEEEFFLILHNACEQTFVIRMESIFEFLLREFNFKTDNEGSEFIKIFNSTGKTNIGLTGETKKIYIRSLSTEIYRIGKVEER